MAASVRSSATYGSTATEASSTVSMPTGWQPGDVVYIGWSLTASNGSVTTPAGWTAVVAGFASNVGTSPTSEHAGTLRRVMQSGDPSTVAISHTSGRFAAVAVAVQGADSTTPEDGVTPTTDSNTGQVAPAMEYPSITPAGSADLLLLVGAGRMGTNNATNTFNAITGFTLVAQQSSSAASTSNSSAVIYSQQLSSNSATGTIAGSFTVSSGTFNSTGQAIAVRPAAGGQSVSLPVVQVNAAAPVPTLSAGGSLAVAQQSVAVPVYESFSTTFDDGTTQGWTATTTGSAALVIDAAAAHDGADGAEYNIGNTSDTAWLSHAITPAPSCTVDGWFQVVTEGPSGTNIPFCEFISGATRIAKAYRQNVTGTASFEYTETDGVTHHFNNSALVLATGTWHHVIFMWNVNGTFFFAVDNQQLLSTVTPTGFFSAPSIDTVYIGAERSDNPGNWYVDTLTVMPSPPLELSVPLAVAQVTVSAPAPTVTGGGQTVSLTAAQVSVAAPAPSPGISPGLPVAQVTVAAPVPSLRESLALTTAQVNVTAPAPSPKIQLTLPVAQVSAAALAPSPKVQLGVAVARVAISALAPTVTVGGAPQTVNLAAARITAAALAPSLAVRAALSAPQISVSARALSVAGHAAPFTVGTLSAVTAPRVTLAATDSPESALTASTAPSSTITAGTQRTGGPGG